MRAINHLLCESKTGKSAILKVEISDRFGKRTINLSSVKGWRKDVAIKYLVFNTSTIHEVPIRIYVGLEIIKIAKDELEALYFINLLKSFSTPEIHFWSNKFLTNKRTKLAWNSFYKKD